MNRPFHGCPTIQVGATGIEEEEEEDHVTGINKTDS
jgi:hypothetical protein